LTAVWQERARMLADQLALAAPQSPVEASTAPEPPEPTGGCPGALVARLVVVVRPSRAAVIVLVATVAVAICVLTITWAAADLLGAFARYRGTP
jgi:hypothetical protein